MTRLLSFSRLLHHHLRDNLLVPRMRRAAMPWLNILLIINLLYYALRFCALVFTKYHPVGGTMERILYQFLYLDFFISWLLRAGCFAIMMHITATCWRQVMKPDDHRVLGFTDDDWLFAIAGPQFQVLLWCSLASIALLIINFLHITVPPIMEPWRYPRRPYPWFQLSMFTNLLCILAFTAMEIAFAFATIRRTIDVLERGDRWDLPAQMSAGLPFLLLVFLSAISLWMTSRGSMALFDMIELQNGLGSLPERGRYRLAQSIANIIQLILYPAAGMALLGRLNAKG